MSIPDVQALLLTLLRSLEDRHEHGLEQLSSQLAAQFGMGLADDEQQARFSNRVANARDELSDLRLLRRTSWGRLRITKLGLRTLRGKPGKQPGRLPKGIASKQPLIATSELLATPPQAAPLKERIEADYLALQKLLGDELIARILQASPRLFEYLCVDLLVAMGYSGGSRKEVNAQVTKASGDEGIDGIVRGNDKLNLYTVYIQAKRYQPSGWAANVAGVRGVTGGYPQGSDRRVHHHQPLYPRSKGVCGKDRPPDRVDRRQAASRLDDRVQTGRDRGSELHPQPPGRGLLPEVRGAEVEGAAWK